jgi:hypothetical protein
MNDDEFFADLAALEAYLDRRVEVWVSIIDPDGTVVERIYRGSFIAPPGSRVGEPRQKEKTS